MTNNPRVAIQNLREQIAASDALTDRDREKLQEFSNRLDLLQSIYGDQRHEKHLRACTIMAGQSPAPEDGGIPDEELPDGELSPVLEDGDRVDDLVRWINDRYDNEETNRDYRQALRIFGKRLAEVHEGIATDDNGIPQTLADVPTGTSRNYNPVPDPSEMLDWDDDVVPMIEETRNNRDAALIAVAWDSGARGGEITDLTVGDVTDSRHGLKITVDGKTGQRSVLLVPSVPHLNRWLAEHPAPDDDKAPLWSKLTTADGMTYQGLRKPIKDAQERAGVSKPTTFTNFRKSQAAHLASRGMNEAMMKDHLGWSQGSSVASRYVSVFGEDSDRELAKLHGKDVDEADEPEPIAPIPCPRCDRENPRDRESCMFCQQALDVEEVAAIRDRQREVRNAALRLVSQRPDLVDEIEATEDLMTIFEDDPELREEADALVDALEGDGRD